MRRREFFAFVGAGAMLPLGARAQQSTKMYRIAIVHPLWPVAELTETSSNRFWRELFLEIRRLGYVEGQNLAIERYSGEGRAELYPMLARDVANSNPNLIVVFTDWMVLPVKAATSTIPIVAMTTDPVKFGLVPSMSRPGGNITGVSIDAGLDLWEGQVDPLDDHTEKSSAIETYRCQSRLVCTSRRDRTSFAPETTHPKRNERDRIETKRQQHQRSRSLSRRS
jgi:putative ABC transport system substrate-binding protein